MPEVAPEPPDTEVDLMAWAVEADPIARTVWLAAGVWEDEEEPS